MKKQQGSPYGHLEELPEWSVLEKALGDLVKNRDLIEQTPRSYIVGYLVKALQENKE
ncbi:hypothetical protein BH09VER1_BH09VER1_01090 [soil metagenome]